MSAPTATRSGTAPLILHEEVSTPTAGGCSRWPKSLRLLSSGGELVLGRCNSPNKCDYCAKLSAVEWSEMMALDALDGVAPTVWMVLTTADAQPDPAAFHLSREKLMRAVRRRFPACEYVCVTEFTTGYGPRSGGLRRPHWNILLKGVSADDIPEVEAIVRRVWCGRENASPEAQFVGEVTEVGGLMRYIALHFLKESQRPPDGWRGHRVTASRGYFTDARWRLRKRAQESLRTKREVRKALLEGYTAVEVEVVASGRALRARGRRWEVVKLHANANGEVTARTLGNREPRVLRPDPRPAASWVPDLMRHQARRARIAGEHSGETAAVLRQ